MLTDSAECEPFRAAMCDPLPTANDQYSVSKSLDGHTKARLLKQKIGIRLKLNADV